MGDRVWMIFMWACIAWVVPVLYAVQRNEAKFKKNIAVGVTLPFEARSDPAVADLLRRYRRALGWACLGLFLASLPMLLTDRLGVSFTIMMVWVLLLCVVPPLPYVWCNRRLRKLKRERGWMPERPQAAVADLSVAAEPVRRVHGLWFLLPAAITLIPAVWKGDLFAWILCGTFALCVLVFWFSYRWLYRNRAETVDENRDLTAALTRIRRRNWARCWLWCAWLTAAYSLAAGAAAEWRGSWFLALTLLYTFALCLTALHAEFATRRIQEKLTARSGQDFYVDEDDHWICGLFYYNPDDSRLIINSRVGINSTFNLARPAAKVIMSAIVLLLLCCPLFGVWMMAEEEGVVDLTVTAEQVEAVHSGSRYTVALEDIQSAEVLQELPEMRRTWGTAMSSVLKGNFSSGKYGKLTVCLDPRQGPFLLITTREGDRYLLGDSTPDGVEAALAALGSDG